MEKRVQDRKHTNGYAKKTKNENLETKNSYMKWKERLFPKEKTARTVEQSKL